MRAALVAAVAGLLLGASGAAASPADVATEVSTNVMSPFCPGLTLHDCPSGAAAELRGRIERWARAGMTAGQIMARLEAEYGPAIAAAPQPRGTGLLAWLLPVVGVVAGAAAATVLARRWSRRARPALAARQPASPAERALLEEELTQIRGER